MTEAVRLEPRPGIRVFRYGQGPRAIVGLPGWSGNHRAFEPLLFLRPSDVSLYVLDLPGFGESAPPASWELPAYAAQVREAIRDLRLDAFELAGNCAGGVIALEVLREAPVGASRLMLIDPFGFVPWYFALLTVPVLGRLFYLSTFANPLGRVLTNLALRKRRAEETNLAEGFIRVDHAASHRFLAMLCRGRDLGRYRDLTVPVDIVFGERTFAAVRRSVASFAALWPDRTTTRELPDAGHLPIVEQPAQVAEVLFHEAAIDGGRAENGGR